MRTTSIVLMAGLGLAMLTACSERAAPLQASSTGLRAHELVQRQQCLARLKGLWGRSQPVRSTTQERGRNGLDYMWVNVAVSDDADDLAARARAGIVQAGHCQFDEQRRLVQVHSYSLAAYARAEPAAAGQIALRTDLPASL